MPKHAQPRRSVAIRAPKFLPPTASAASKANDGTGVSGMLAMLGESISGSSAIDEKRTDASGGVEEQGLDVAERKHLDQPLPPKGVRAIHRPPHDPKVTSAAEWNSLLCWARRQRGPQWDESTGW